MLLLSLLNWRPKDLHGSAGETSQSCPCALVTCQHTDCNTWPCMHTPRTRRPGEEMTLNRRHSMPAIVARLACSLHSNSSPANAPYFTAERRHNISLNHLSCRLCPPCRTPGSGFTTCFRRFPGQNGTTTGSLGPGEGGTRKGASLGESGTFPSCRLLK